MHHPTDRITHTTAFVTPVVEHWLEREIAQWVHLEGSRQNQIYEDKIKVGSVTNTFLLNQNHKLIGVVFLYAGLSLIIH